MSDNGQSQRVIVQLRHGAHAIVDEAPGAADALDKGSARLSEVAQNLEIGKVDVEAALSLAGVTDFDYLFPDVVTDAANLLPAGTPDAPSVTVNTVKALNDLGNAMIEQAPTAPNSSIPPIFTYWGQFVDHDLTAATDNDKVIGIDATPLAPMDPSDVTALLVNKRNPALNLDSVYGDGPFAAPKAGQVTVPYQAADKAKLELGKLDETNGAAGVLVPPVNDIERDLPRENLVAQIGDGRNDENLVVAQLHVAFLRFHNSTVDWVRANEPEFTGVGEVFSRARDLVRWTYQWLCVHEYLGAVLHPGSVDQVLASEDDLLGLAGRAKPYMPLEFSVAAFRFGHSMIRGVYDWNRNFGDPGTNFAPEASLELLFQFTGTGKFINNAPTLPDNWPAEWDRFVETSSAFPIRSARPIDTFLAGPLQDMENQLDGTNVDPTSDLGKLLKHLARRNLLRGFRLSIPTGQAMARALGIPPLTATELTNGIDQKIHAALTLGGFVERTPLWFYVLRESEVRNSGTALGPVGSRIVAETIIGQIRKDPRSYLNQTAWTPSQGVKLPDGSAITSVEKFFRFAGVLCMATTLREQQELAASRYKRRAPERAETERKQEAMGTLVADDPEQIEARAERLLGDAVGSRAVRQAARHEGVLERIIAENDLQPSLFLGRGTAIAESVGRISLADGGAGTGFLVGRRLLLTNNHVLPDAASAAGAFVEFDFELGTDGRPEAPAAFDLAPGTLFLTDAEIDASLVAVAPASGVVAGDKYGWNKLLKQQGKIVIGEAANVIGHPSGRRKEIAVRNNRLLDQLPDFLHYEADTEPGNSGSPVFNDQWEVVALHHSGVPRTNDAGQWLTTDGAVWDRSMGDAAVAWVANEGARISVVLTRLRALARTPAQTALLDELGVEALVGAGPTEGALRPTRTAREITGRAGVRAVPETPPHIVFLHGRSQQGRDPLVLRAEWAGGLARGLGAVGRAPLDPARVWFPFYGDVLAELAGPSAVERTVIEDDGAPAAVRAAPSTTSARATYAALIEDAAGLAGFRAQPSGGREGLGDLVAGLQPALSWLADKSRLDDLFIAVRFRDVALYLEDDATRTRILSTVLETIPASGPVTLVSHSLGTVVAMDLLTRLPAGVEVRLLVTAGSPLGMDSVNKRLLLGGPRRPDVGRWINAWCPADAVAIGAPLAPVWDGVEDVQTAKTGESAHSIVEYLADLRVASAIGEEA